MEFTVGHPPFNLLLILTSRPNSCPSLSEAFFSHTESVCVCVYVCTLKAPSETLSEPQPVSLAMIMTTLSRAVEHQQKKIVVCFPITLWALGQKEQREKSEIKIWHFSGRGMGEVFYFSLPPALPSLLPWGCSGSHVDQLPCWDN